MKGIMAFSLFLTTSSTHAIIATPQGVLPRSPIGGVELPQTIKLITGGPFVGTTPISFKATRCYKKPPYGNLFDSSSSEDEHNPEITSDTLKKYADDNQHIAQYGETSNEGDCLSYGNEDTRTPSNMGTNKQMEDIVVAGSEEDSRETRKFIFQLQGNQPLWRRRPFPLYIWQHWH